MANHESTPHNQPEPDAGGEKKERRKRRRRAPSHVPLHIQADVAERQQRDRLEENVEHKSHRKRKKKPEAAALEPVVIEKDKDTVPKDHATSHEEEPAHDPEAKEQKAESHEDEAEAKSIDEAGVAVGIAEYGELAEKEPVPAANDSELAEIPLDADEVEEEVFVSPRLQRQIATIEEPVSHTTEDEPDEEAAAVQSTASLARPPVIVPPAPPNVPPVTPPSPPRTPNVPPSPPIIGGNLPPVPPYTPNLYQGGGGNIVPPTPIAAAANRTPSTQPNPNALNQFQERRHNGRAILAGILVGGLIEHIRHKRREKRMVKAHTKEVKELKKEQQATNMRLRENEVKHEETARKKTALERQLERLKTIPSPAEQVPLAAVPKETARKATVSKTEVVSSAERPKVTKVEKELSEAETAIKKAQEAVERAHQNLDERPELPPDRIVETSAWHRIEVDKKTGKAVETPTIAYGEEFQHEQHQERLRKAADEASMGSDMIREQYSPFKTLPTPTAGTTNEPKKALPAGSRSAKDQALQKARDIAQNTNPVDAVLWVVLLIVVLLIIAAL